jgi:hypothetical protein
MPSDSINEPFGMFLDLFQLRFELVEVDVDAHVNLEDLNALPGSFYYSNHLVRQAADFADVSRR